MLPLQLFTHYLYPENTQYTQYTVFTHTTNVHWNKLDCNNRETGSNMGKTDVWLKDLQAQFTQTI